ncbi:MAG: hypothetical protein IJV04_08705, partial [Lachnospiraceae bacterium]|nr:hypothetical protein [Lachnospiraceae bacterium]
MPFSFETISDNRNGHFLVKWRKKKKFPEWEQGFSIVAEAAKKYENILLSDEALWSVQRHKGFWKRV